MYTVKYYVDKNKHIYNTFDFEVLSFFVGETILESLTARSLLRDFPLGLL